MVEPALGIDFLSGVLQYTVEIGSIGFLGKFRM